MDLRQLRYFVALATQQHYGKAAKVLHVAQPALSRQIRLLEEELGVQLFERHARGATPTDEARLLLERAVFLLRYAEQTKQDLMARHQALSATQNLDEMGGELRSIMLGIAHDAYAQQADRAARANDLEGLRRANEAIKRIAAERASIRMSE